MEEDPCTGVKELGLLGRLAARGEKAAQGENQKGRCDGREIEAHG